MKRLLALAFLLITNSAFAGILFNCTFNSNDYKVLANLDLLVEGSHVTLTRLDSTAQAQPYACDDHCQEIGSSSDAGLNFTIANGFNSEIEYSLEIPNDFEQFKQFNSSISFIERVGRNDRVFFYGAPNGTCKRAN